MQSRFDFTGPSTKGTKAVIQPIAQKHVAKLVFEAISILKAKTRELKAEAR